MTIPPLASAVMHNNGCEHQQGEVYQDPACRSDSAVCSHAFDSKQAVCNVSLLWNVFSTVNSMNSTGTNV